MMGNKFGIKCALVLTGVSKRADLEASEHKPDYVLNSIPELLGLDLFKQLQQTNPL
jgi:ribonucleotide monophosphatase NagD (HAD superfamily)